MASEAKPSSRAAGRAATGYAAVIASDSIHVIARERENLGRHAASPFASLRSH